MQEASFWSAKKVKTVHNIFCSMSIVEHKVSHTVMDFAGTPSKDEGWVSHRH